MHWDYDWHHGNGPGWWWAVMAIMMIAFWGTIVWLIAMAIQRGHRTDSGPHSSATAPSDAPSPEAILHERLARGEIAIDEYRDRLGALRSQQNPPAHDS